MINEPKLLRASYAYPHGKIIMLSGLLLTIFFMICLAIYARIWESTQPYCKLKQQKVDIIEPYSAINDLHWNSSGYRIYLESISQPIDFPINYYNKSIKAGSIVDITIRKSFSWFGLKDEFDGIAISYSADVIQNDNAQFGGE